MNLFTAGSSGHTGQQLPCLSLWLIMTHFVACYRSTDLKYAATLCMYPWQAVSMKPMWWSRDQYLPWSWGFLHKYPCTHSCPIREISFCVLPFIWTVLFTSASSLNLQFSAGKTAVWFTNQSQAAHPRRLTLSFKTNPFIFRNRDIFRNELWDFSADQLTGVHSMWLWVTACVHMWFNPSLSHPSVLSSVFLCLFTSLF